MRFWFGPLLLTAAVVAQANNDERLLICCYQQKKEMQAGHECHDLVSQMDRCPEVLQKMEAQHAQELARIQEDNRTKWALYGIGLPLAFGILFFAREQKNARKRKKKAAIVPTKPRPQRPSTPQRDLGSYEKE
jgi:hypothetical protein